MSKTYLGDGVYADVERGLVKLTAENGYGVSNTIYLEPEMVAELVRYATNQADLIVPPAPRPTTKKPSPAALMRAKRRLRRR